MIRTTIQATKSLCCATAAGLLLAGPLPRAEEIQVPAQTGEAVESGTAAGEGGAPKREPIIRETFGSSDIKDWYAPDDRTLVIGTYAHGKFLGTFANLCTGIRYANALGFSTQGPFELDRSTAIVLPDGQRCFFKDLSAYSLEQEIQDRAARAKPAAAERRK
ncbi:MAG: hypothetical protein HYY48_06115 [Gammaproteobacteria bacterium]|nr:hypothetical protein [Gammaproteobacteria bacterium]